MFGGGCGDVVGCLSWLVWICVGLLLCGDLVVGEGLCGFGSGM